MEKKEVTILGLIGMALSVFVFFKDPFDGPILPCIFNKITGLYCPGCGMTRAVNSCFKLNFYQAFRFNALLFILPIIFIFYLLAKAKKQETIAQVILGVMLAIAIAYGVLRNLPSFEFLAPSFY